MTLRTGITTGTCAAAAAKAAVMVLVGRTAPGEVAVTLPGGQSIRVPILYARASGNGGAVAAVRKDAGDDPDVTHGLEVVVMLTPSNTAGVTFLAGEGVGMVTAPGLQVPPGEPAINPAPRRMIEQAITEIVPPTRGMIAEIGIPGGREIATKTFNPRLGIEGGLSVLGTSGIVRPYCTKALHDALKCSLDVAAACGVRAPAFVPGNIGAKAAQRHFTLAAHQLVEVGNAWGFVLELVGKYPFEALLVAGHPGKLAKVAKGDWDTHSSQSASAVPYVAALHEQVLGRPVRDTNTVEGIFGALAAADRKTLGDALAAKISDAVRDKCEAGRAAFATTTVLVDMAGNILGTSGDLSRWQ